MLSSFKKELRSSNDFLLNGKTFDTASKVSGANLFTYGYKDEFLNILSLIIPKLFKKIIIRLATNNPFIVPNATPKILSIDFVNLFIFDNLLAIKIPAIYIKRKITINDTEFKIRVSFINLFNTNANPE